MTERQEFLNYIKSLNEAYDLDRIGKAYDTAEKMHATDGKYSICNVLHTQIMITVLVERISQTHNRKIRL